MSDTVSAPSPEVTAGGARIAVLATLPVFLKLGGRRVVLAGAGDPALWKAELLAAAGPELHIFAEHHEPAMCELAAKSTVGRIVLHERRWQAGDLVGAAVVIGACEDDGEAAELVAAARAAGVPVNVIDKPEYCDFQFGAIVNRSPLIVAISTDGAAPVFGQAVRARIETQLPIGFQRWAEAAKAWRVPFQAQQPDFKTRRRFWERFTAFALASPDRAPADEDFAACLAAAKSENAPQRAQRGQVAFVLVATDLAGADAAERLTLKAARLLGAADAVIHGPAIPAAVLDLARREARRLVVESGDGGRLAADLAAQGQAVVRLVARAQGTLALSERTEIAARGIVIDVVGDGVALTTPV